MSPAVYGQSVSASWLQGWAWAPWLACQHLLLVVTLPLLLLCLLPLLLSHPTTELSVLLLL